MTAKLLTEKHLEFLSLKGGCTGSSESTLVKMPHCWKSNVTAHYGLSILQLTPTKFMVFPTAGFESRPQGYKTFSMLNSAEHEISNAN